jgi:acyl-CoA thioesterase I
MRYARAVILALRYGGGHYLVNAWLVSFILALAVVTGGARFAAAQPANILALGDSLTAGYGLEHKDSFPTRLEAALKAAGHDVRVINAGVSGDTSAGGLSRLAWALADKPSLAIVELGANDGLRGLDPQSTFDNLDAIIGRLKAAGVDVLLAGMLAPPNLGREYGAEFKNNFPRLAAQHDVVLYPFFLDGVAADPALNQGDGIHPNAAGVNIIVERLMPYVTRLLGGGG